jgi:hypothetical protein
MIENRSSSVSAEAVFRYSHAVIVQHRCVPYKQSKGHDEAKNSVLIFHITYCIVMYFTHFDVNYTVGEDSCVLPRSTGTLFYNSLYFINSCLPC